MASLWISDNNREGRDASVYYRSVHHLENGLIITYEGVVYNFQSSKVNIKKPSFHIALVASLHSR